MRSLRVRLVVGLCIALCTLWGGVAAWMFAGMRNDLRSVLDERLIASSRMVAGIVHQFKPENHTPQDWGPMLNVIARDGVACEVSMVRSEVHAAGIPSTGQPAAAAAPPGAPVARSAALIPASPLERKTDKPVAPQPTTALNAAVEKPGAVDPQDRQVVARTAGGPSFQSPQPLGFSTVEKGGRLWRTYVLEEHGVRIATADRLDVRERLVQGFAYTIVLPFVLALLASMVLMWWAVSRGLRPLESLRQELSRRPPGDDSPVAQGQQVRELAPLVQTINHLLQRVHGAIERERRWSDDAAHELRTPLTAVKTHVQVAQMAVASASQQMVAAEQTSGQAGEPVTLHPIAETPQWNMARMALVQAGEGVEHLQHTLEQLLLLARLDCKPDNRDEKDVVCGTEPGPALESLEKAWALAATAIPAGEQRLQWLPDQAHDDVRLEDLHVVVPQPLLVSALRNLLENALRYAHAPTADGQAAAVHLGLRHVMQLPRQALAGQGVQGSPAGEMPSGTAGAALAAPHGYVEFTVADQGPGLSEEDCEVAVQRFWRKQHQAHGSGLGLAIVQRIAQCSGGELQLLPRAQWLALQQEPQDSAMATTATAPATGLVVRLYLRVAGFDMECA